MPDSYYDDGSDSSPSQAEGDEMDDSKDSKPTKDDNAKTALLPKSFFKNRDKLDVGDVEKIEIVHIYEDEVEAKCVYSKDKKDDSPDPDEDKEHEEMSGAMGRMDDAYA